MLYILDKEALLAEIIASFRDVALSLMEELNQIEKRLALIEEKQDMISKRLESIENLISASNVSSVDTKVVSNQLHKKDSFSVEKQPFVKRKKGIFGFLRFCFDKNKDKKDDSYMKEYIDFLKKNPEKVFLLPADKIDK